ncbi:MAG: hypothetical protein ACK4GG_02465 [Sphingomonas sp.]
MIAMRSFPALTLGVILSGAATPAIAAQCASGWGGTVHYSRTQETHDSKTVPKLSGKGSHTTTASMTYNYAAQVVVRPTPDPDASIAKTNINLAQVASETVRTTDEDVCLQTRERRQVSGTSESKSVISANASNLEAEVNVSLDSDDSYRISVRLPQLQGTASGSISSSFSGQCVAKKGVNQTVPESPYSIDPVSFASDGDDRINPSDPNRLTGSFVKTWSGVTERLSWNLRRCGSALRLVGLKFEDMRFPNWEDWQDISDQRGTIDGNIVRMTAIVANDGDTDKAATVKFKETYKGDKWDSAKPDGTLNNLSVIVPAGQQREVKFNWDSSGYAWYDDGRPRLIQRIRAELEEKGKRVDDQTRNLKVVPKPLVLVHGLWSNWGAWASWQNILTTTHSYDWKAFPVGERPEYGRMNTGEEVGNFGATYTIAQNAFELGKYVRYAQRDRNAWHIDLVAHSMGGLISRRYIHDLMPSYADGRPQVSRLVMLGTPNMGSVCADQISAALEYLEIPMHALRELRPSVVAQFNATMTKRKGVQFSVLAGNVFPAICTMAKANDGVVAVESARWTIADAAEDNVIHTAMTEAGPFGSFVKPRLAQGPSAYRGTDGGGGSGGGGGGGAAARIMLTDDGVPTPEPSSKADFAKLVKLAPGQTIDVAIPVKAARNLGLTLVAASVVSATLIDDTGAVAGRNDAATPEASQTFRSILVDRPVTRGRWTLKLHNSGETEREVLLSSWSSAQ